MKPDHTLLILLGIVLPFSIAASNILFAGIIVLSMFSLQWWRGAQCLNNHYPWLLRSWIAYMVLFLAGLLWTPDLQWGLHLLTKQWSWLLVPAIVGILIHHRIDSTSSSQYTRPQTVLWAVSAGLLVHLMACSIQWLGFLPNLNPPYSSSTDATGMIGHIGFGLIYGMWAALLTHWGLQQHGWKRAALWGTALWSATMVFLAEGRSGYLVVLALSLLLAAKLIFTQLSRTRFLMIATVACTIIAAVLWQSDALHKRIQWTVQSLQQAEKGNLNNAEPRLSLWSAAWHGWLENPAIGVGTGGFPTLSRQMSKQYGLLYESKPFATHPHQMYLMDLVRWGPLGLLALLAFFGTWIAAGWRNMKKSYYNTLIVASGVALAVHGLSAPSLEDYYSSIYGALFLAIGLAGRVTEGVDKA